MSSIKERIAALQKAGAGDLPKSDSASSDAATSPAPAPIRQSNISSSSSTTTATFRQSNISTSPKCAICSKTVFKPEEVLALGKVYHGACFTCSCPTGDGCGRSLKGGDYVEHNSNPYCKNCHNKIFGPKGVNAGLGSAVTLEKGDKVIAATVIKSASTTTPVSNTTASSSASASDPVAESARMSRMHQAWIVDTLQASGGQCTLGALVHRGESQQCDTVGSMLKILKNKKVIDFKGAYLMYPMHEAEIVSLVDASVLGDLSEALAEANACRLPGDHAVATDAFTSAKQTITVVAPVPAVPSSPVQSIKPPTISAGSTVLATTTVAASGSTAAAVTSKAATVAAKFGGGNSVKCFVCTKTVFKVEETVAMGRTYHSSCFTCGSTVSNPTGNNNLGCKRVLKIMEGYMEHKGEDKEMIPYCKACYNKLYAPKGVHAGNAASMGVGSIVPIPPVGKEIAEEAVVIETNISGQASSVESTNAMNVALTPVKSVTAMPSSSPIEGSVAAALSPPPVPMTLPDIPKSPAINSSTESAVAAGVGLSTKRNSITSRMGGLDLSKVGLGLPGMGGPPAHLMKKLSSNGVNSPIRSDNDEMESVVKTAINPNISCEVTTPVSASDDHVIAAALARPRSRSNRPVSVKKAILSEDLAGLSLSLAVTVEGEEPHSALNNAATVEPNVTETTATV